VAELEVYGKDGQVHDLAWLQANYGAGLKVLRSNQTHAFRLRKINIMTSGEVLIRIWVMDKTGKPAVGQPVTYTYPSLGSPSGDLQLISGVLDCWAPRGVLNKNRVSGAGTVEFQIGDQSWIKGGRGPYSAFVLSPTAGSDCIDGTGWLGGTNHEGPTELFFYEEDGTTPPPPDPSGDLTEVLARIAVVDAKVTVLGAHLGVKL
jgi:hypothetical protein